MTTIDSSQQARYVISVADDRGFEGDYSLAAESSDPTFVAVELLEATSGTASGKDELLAKFVAPGGAAVVKVFDPAQPDLVMATDTVDTTVGVAAGITLGAPTIEEV